MAMFWRFGFKPASAIDLLLDREGGTTLKELLEQEEFLQEVKDQNVKLLDFLMRPESIKAMLQYAAEKPGPSKPASLVCEIFSFDIQSLSSAVVAQSGMLGEYWDTVLASPLPIDPFLAGAFSKITCVLLSRNTCEMMEFLQGREGVLQAILKYISSPAMYDVVLKLITLEEAPEGAGVISWVNSQGLIAQLISQLDPTLDPDVHSCASQSLLDMLAVSYQSTAPPDEFRVISANALIRELKGAAMMNQLLGFMLNSTAPHMGSSLMNGSNIVIDLIRRYCSEIEQAEYQLHHHQLQPQQPLIPAPTNEKLQELSHFLNDLLSALHTHIPAIVALLLVEQEPIDTTMGKLRPLGSLRFKVCELLAEILHLQYLFSSSPLFPIILESFGTQGILPEANVAYKLAQITERIVQSRGLVICLDVFFKYPWNNFLHSVVYDMVAKVFNLYCFLMTAGLVRLPEAGAGPGPSSPSITESSTLVIKETIQKLVLSAFLEGRLTHQIVEAQRLNDAAVQEPRGVRLGYMGHMTYIADEVCKLVEKCDTVMMEQLREDVQSEAWTTYVNGVLRETKERDRQLLGGYRPEPVLQPQMLGGLSGSMLDPADTGAIHTRPMPLVREGGEENEDDGPASPVLTAALTGEGFPIEGAVASDQLARFLVQQIVSDLPDRFLGTASSDEDDDNDVEDEDRVRARAHVPGGIDSNPPASWLSEYDSNDIRFDIREAFNPDAAFPDVYELHDSEEDGLPEGEGGERESVGFPVPETMANPPADPEDGLSVDASTPDTPAHGLPLAEEEEDVVSMVLPTALPGAAKGRWSSPPSQPLVAFAVAEGGEPISAPTPAAPGFRADFAGAFGTHALVAALPSLEPPAQRQPSTENVDEGSTAEPDPGPGTSAAPLPDHLQIARCPAMEEWMDTFGIPSAPLVQDTAELASMAAIFKANKM